MEELERRSHGAWRPSPGSVYPTLSQLEDEANRREQGRGANRPTASPTRQGLRRQAPRRARRAVGEAVRGHWREAARAARAGPAQIGAATFQVGVAGDDDQVARAEELLAETRRRLYKILADDQPES